MRRVLALAFVCTAALLSGCSGGDKGSLDKSSDKSSVKDEKFSAKDGDDYKACYDGTCEVEIRKKATIAMDEDKLGTPELDVTVANGEITVLVAHPKGEEGHGTVSISGNGVSAMNGLVFQSPLINDDIAVLNIDYQG